MPHTAWPRRGGQCGDERARRRGGARGAKEGAKRGSPLRFGAERRELVVCGGGGGAERRGNRQKTPREEAGGAVMIFEYEKTQGATAATRTPLACTRLFCFWGGGLLLPPTPSLWALAGGCSVLRRLWRQRRGAARLRAGGTRGQRARRAEEEEGGGRHEGGEGNGGNALWRETARAGAHWCARGGPRAKKRRGGGRAGPAI